MMIKIITNDHKKTRLLTLKQKNMKRIWKIIENKKIKDILKLKCCVQIKEGKKIIGSIGSKENKRFNVATAQGTGTYFDNFDECINWLKMLNSDILGKNQEFIIKY